MSKPFSLPELKTRIYAIIRRKQFNTNNLMYSNGVTIDLLKKTVKVGPNIITLTRTEYELLLFLISNKNNECPHVPKLAKFKPPRCPIGVYWNTLCLMRDVWTIKTYMI